MSATGTKAQPAPIVRAAFQLSHTKRWSTAPVPQQSVADHTFRVATVVMAVYDRMPRPHELRLDAMLRAALDHDLAEAYTGDIPALCTHGDSRTAYKEVARIEYGVPGINYLSPTEHCVLKFADLLDAAHWVAHYHASCLVCGNQLSAKMRRNLFAVVNIMDARMRGACCSILEELCLLS